MDGVRRRGGRKSLWTSFDEDLESKGRGQVLGSLCVFVTQWGISISEAEAAGQFHTPRE